ncbi:SDR family NAD(P)-dependent oxidoreductase [Sinisalibacter aestuarii]|uniref:Short chain dehydrogenase n=1 Tax=Sinisalibacter aestuarii TaxID=2949426 RepID=A0ABQ5LYV2_9RHOB|nr:glucose 1-dehydrogenase [Sinisalibacter aestuarii]GKY90132.1 short chain dehydrogenase [Sinisalibacter aestuarii]
MTANEIFDVSGKVAFVTGAGSGLGRAMAEAMAENGANVACFDLDPEGLTETATLLSRLGADVLTFTGDVADEAQVDAAVAETVARFGSLDIAFANAGIGDPEPGFIHEYDSANWRKVVDVNLNGVFNVNRAAIREMMKTGGGKVINTASMWGLAGSSSVFPLPAYNATKGAVVNLTRELGLQYARSNIQVNAICPGFFLTALGPYDDAEFMEAVTGFTPMGRVADPAEIKGTALYLASSASDFVTGTALVIDGGCMAK